MWLRRGFGQLGEGRFRFLVFERGGLGRLGRGLEGGGRGRRQRGRGGRRDSALVVVSLVRCSVDGRMEEWDMGGFLGLLFLGGGR